MVELSKIGKRVLAGSVRRAASVMNQAAKEIRSGWRELLDTPPGDAEKGAAVHGRPPASPAATNVPRLGDPAKPAQVFGRQSCPWTGRTLALLERENSQFEFIDLDAPENGMLTTWLVAETKQNTNPYVFLRGRFIGGFNALDEIVRLGQLSYETMSAQEKARQPSRIRIEVAPRDDHDRPPPGEV
jgi:glutaredoxin